MIGRIGIERSILWALLRAILQLAVVSLILVTALSETYYALLFVAVMFGIASYTTSKRSEVSDNLQWVALAMFGGTAPVFLVIFGLGAAPFNGPSIVPIMSIIIGNTMSGHTLAARRIFAQLRENLPSYDAARALGMTRMQAIPLITEDILKEALIPSLDSVRTVGLVTLPGAFAGVLLGGGTPLQAGAAQILVLVGILTSQVITVTLSHEFVKRTKILTPDLRKRLLP